LSTELLFLRDAYLREFERAGRRDPLPEGFGREVEQIINSELAADHPEVGRIVVVKTESKGKGNKRIRLRIEDS